VHAHIIAAVQICPAVTHESGYGMLGRPRLAAVDEPAPLTRGLRQFYGWLVSNCQF
jgi:hypothetical protein